MTYAFVVNPIAGNVRHPDHWIRQLEECCKERKVDYVLRWTQGPGHGMSLARDAVQQGIDCVVAVGGDGTVNEVARGVLGSKARLGVIPKGSGNGFARELGIPLSPRRACEALLRSQALAMDAGLINGTYFFNLARNILTKGARATLPLKSLGACHNNLSAGAGSTTVKSSNPSLNTARGAI